MIDQLRRMRRAIALPIAVVMGTLAFSVPLLDAGPRGELPSVQADDYAPSSAGHDHSICVLHGASPWSAADEEQVALPLLASDGSEASPVHRIHASFPLASTQPRAPPSA
jgi:hypothetical protein